MTPPTPCPDPSACQWESRSLNGTSVQICRACGRVQLDASALQQLTGGRAALDPPEADSMGPPSPPNPFATATPAPPPKRPVAEPPPPPKASPSSLRNAHTVIPFAAMSPASPAPAPVRRRYQPDSDPDEDAPTLAAAPPPEAATSVDAAPVPASDLRSAQTMITDSRIPTEETEREPAWDARDGEPGLGLSVDHTNLPREGQSFFEPDGVGLRFAVSDDEPDFLEGVDDLEWRPKRSSVPKVLALVALVVFVFGVLGVTIALFLPSLGLDSLGTTASVPPSVADSLAPEEPEVEEPEVEEPEVEEVQDTAAPQELEADSPKEEAVAAEPKPAPAPKPPPTPKTTAAPKPAPKPAPTGFQALVNKGWSVVETDSRAASDHFRKALDAKPGDPEATYGLGYSLLKLGQRNGARAQLCAAASTAESKTAAEIRSILANAELSCD